MTMLRETSFLATKYWYAVIEMCIRDSPNILWITSEDNSPHFVGCYGNPFATTPNIDKLASEGFMYSRAYAAHAVCSPRCV